MTPVQRWEKRAEIPLLLLAVAFLVAYAWLVLDPRMSADLRTLLEVASWTVWAAFIAVRDDGDDRGLWRPLPSDNHRPLRRSRPHGGGIACIGAITAGVAAWLVAQVEAEARTDEADANP